MTAVTFCLIALSILLLWPHRKELAQGLPTMEDFIEADPRPGIE